MKPLEIVWHAPVYDPSGYASCARDYIFALHEAGVKVKVQPVTFWSPIATPAVTGEKLELLKSLENTEVSPTCPRVWHMVPDLYKKLDPKRPEIGYTVFETDGLPPNWLEPMNKMNEILVPCHFNLDTFENGGFNRNKMTVVPHVVDTEFLNPDNYTPIDFTANGILPKKDFYFLTVMDVTHRKGWDIMLRAYLREFAGDNNIGLVFKGYFGGVTENHKKNLITRLQDFCKKLRIQNPPDIIFYGDILDGVDIPRLYKGADCFLSSNRGEGWCTLPDAKIITDNGIKNIIDVTLEDKVVSHTGKLQNVKNLLRREYNGEIINIQPCYNSSHPLRLTPNHKVLTAKNRRDSMQNKIIYDVEWKEAGEISYDDYIAFPKNISYDSKELKIDLDKYINCLNKTTIDNKIYNTNCGHVHHYSVPIEKEIVIDEFWTRLFGYFIAEGWANEKKGVVKICLNQQKDENIRSFFLNNFDHVYIENKTRNRQILNINYRMLAVFLKNFGRNAETKKIPEEIFNIYLSNKELSKILIKSMWEGDGSFTCNSYEYTTISEELTNQIRLLLINLGLFPSVKKTNRLCNFNGKYRMTYQITIKGKDYVNSMNDIIGMGESKSIKNKKNIIEKDDYYWFPIQEIKKENYNGIVYNLSVEEDETYVCDFVAVHNCLPMSEAMAMGVPCIATNWGGPLEFFNPDNGYPIDVLEMKLIDDEMTKITPNYRGQKWAEPSEVHMRQLMREVYENRQEAKVKGFLARKYLQDNFNKKVIAKKIIDVLKKYR